MRVLLVLALLLVAHLPAGAGPREDAFNDAQAFGKARNSTTRDKVNPANASGSVPNYNTTSPEAGYYSKSELTTDGNARTAACAIAIGTSYADQSCDATNFSQTNPGTRPVFTIAPNDSVVARSKTIARDPAAVVGPLDGTYSGCTTTTSTTPPVYENKTCNEFRTVVDQTCSKTLNVTVTQQNTCVPGTWIAVDLARPDAAADHTVALVLCELGRSDGKLTFRFDAYGGQGECIGPQTIDLPIAASTANGVVATLSPHWVGLCQQDFHVVELAGSGCNGTSCDYQFLFAIPSYTCPAGQVPGSRISTGSPLIQPPPADQCYLTQPPDVLTRACPRGYSGPYSVGKPPAVQDLCIRAQGPAVPGPGAWNAKVPVVFEYPHVKTTLTDTWNNECAAIEQRVTDGTCQPLSSVCGLGPSTRTIFGVPVTRDCWRQDLTFKCAGTAPSSDCKVLRTAGCEQIGSKCIDVRATCTLLEQTYRCKVKDGVTSTITDCGSQSFCLTGSCFDAGYPPDKDFAAAVTMMEAGKEMGAQFDPKTFRVFKGTDNRCDKKFFSGFNCCEVGDAINQPPLKQACTNDEKALAKLRDERHCHMVGSYCSQKFLGTCAKKTETYCCFLSLLARVIHEQGRPQLPRGWGEAEKPDCAGLTVVQLQSLDFAKMDLSEFYAEIKATLPNTAALQGKAGTTESNCYFGKGKC